MLMLQMHKMNCHSHQKLMQRLKKSRMKVMICFLHQCVLANTVQDYVCTLCVFVFVHPFFCSFFTILSVMVTF